MAEEEKNQTPTETAETETKTDEATKPAEEVFYGKGEEKTETKASEEEKSGGEGVDVKETEEVQKPPSDKILGKKPELVKEKTDTKPEEFSLKVPENSLLGAERANEIKSYAKDRGLSQEVAQDILNSENQVLANYVEQFKPGGPAWSKVESALREKTMSDPVVGGTDENLKKSVSLAGEAMSAFLSPDEKTELQNLLHTSGYGSHPLVLKMLRKAGEIVTSDKIEKGNAVDRKKEKTIEEIFYPEKQAQNSA